MYEQHESMDDIAATAGPSAPADEPSVTSPGTALALSPPRDGLAFPGGSAEPLAISPQPTSAHCLPGAFKRNDMGNARRLTELFGGQLGWCKVLDRWFIWTGRRWRVDEGRHALTLAKRTADSIFLEAAAELDEKEAQRLLQWANASSNRGRINAMLELAGDDLALFVPQLDADPWLLNCLNGTLDLRSGTLQAHDPADHLTRLVPLAFQPDAHLAESTATADPALTWRNFLQATCGDDPELQAYLQRAVGLTLIGEPLESVLFFAYGPPGTGKTTFLDILLLVLGDYAAKVTGDALLTRYSSSGLRPEIAALRGTRLVVCDETNKGRRLDVGLVNDLTGGAVITARALYQNAVTFPRTFTPWLASNYRPEVAEDDDSGIWRRLREIPFDQPVADHARQRNIAARLVREAGSAILAWAVAGALQVQADGLGQARRVADATAAFKDSMNPLADWLAERCRVDPTAWANRADLWRDYNAWCAGAGERPVGRKEFFVRLGQVFRYGRRSAGHGYVGLTLSSGYGPVGTPMPNSHPTELLAGQKLTQSESF